MMSDEIGEQEGYIDSSVDGLKTLVTGSFSR